MKALILAAGYGTRLYPLTKDMPKPLLPFNQKPLLNYLTQKIEDLKNIREIIIVTNERFYALFESWAAVQKSPGIPFKILNDGTKSPEDRLGAMGDIDFVLKKDLVKEDLAVLGGDNLFDYSLKGFIVFAQKKSPQVTIGLYDIKDIARAGQYGVVALNSEGKVVSFEEKPKAPKSTMIAMCLYYLPVSSFRFIADYLAQSKSADTTGDYIRWLSQRETVYGFKFEGQWYDIGSIEEYESAQKEFK